MNTNKAIQNIPTVRTNKNEEDQVNVCNHGKALVRQWGYFHAVRSAIGLVVFSLLA